MKKNLYSFLTLAALLSLFVPAVSLAAGYVPLEPLPFLSPSGYGTNLPALLQALFQLLIIGGAGVATLMITIGGIQYMTGDALHQKSEGRERIKNSVFGLLLLLSIYLILRTINPQLLNFDLSQITKVGEKSNERVQEAKQTTEQREAAAASPGPAAAAASGGSTSGAPTYSSPSGMGADGYPLSQTPPPITSESYLGGSIPSAQTPPPVNASDFSPYVANSEAPPPVRGSEFGSYNPAPSENPAPVTAGSFNPYAVNSELSGTQMAPRAQTLYSYSGNYTTFGRTEDNGSPFWGDKYGIKDISYTKYFPTQQACVNYSQSVGSRGGTSCKTN